MKGEEKKERRGKEGGEEKERGKSSIAGLEPVTAYSYHLK